MKELLIIGNPNTGKTTLFNTITGSKNKTANYSGVTVEPSSKKVLYKNQEFKVVDLPGLYSFQSDSQDEKVTIEYLSSHKDDPVVYVCSSCDINKNFILLSELINLGHKIMLVINENGKKIKNDELKNLEKNLGVPIFKGDVRRNRAEILDWVSSAIAKSIERKVDVQKLISLLKIDNNTLKMIDRILLHRVWGKLVFVCVVLGVIYISYGNIGAGVSSYFNSLLQKFSCFLIEKTFIGDYAWLEDLIVSVFINGLGAVLVYLPQLAIMLSLLFFLEEVGYLPRVGAVFNLQLERFGLNGKSIFGLMMGLGCTTSAVLTTRNIGEINARKSTVNMLPFIGCSAKVPIIIFISQVVLGGAELLTICLLYFSAIFIGMSYLYITRTKEGGSYFISEIPNLKIPSIKNVVKKSLYIVLDLLKKISLTVIISTLIVWLLLNISADFKFMEGSTSLLEIVVEKISILFYPLGLNRKDVLVALILGLIAKENIVSTMGMFGMAGSLSVVQAITFLLFITIYSPCIPAIKCAKCEFGKKFAIGLFVKQMLIAYAVCFVFSTFASFGVLIGAVAGILICLMLVILKTIKNKNIAKNPLFKQKSV